MVLYVTGTVALPLSLACFVLFVLTPEDCLPEFKYSLESSQDELEVARSSEDPELHEL